MATIAGGASAKVLPLALLLLAAEAAAVVVTAAAGGDEAAAGIIIRPPCFHACFDQCVPREEYWFCQFSCYHSCFSGAGAGAGAGRFPGDCEHACALSMCSQIDPDSKVMAVCLSTCARSYAVAGCRRRPTASSFTAAL
ncbi:uncharacterized protein LOC121053277 [Oryza brachyantha]|uniref:uncharacterized protein LOC121053277 n=1 Tax=Oryza brachyantha TaxID=4533 RepID=UPI001AD9BC68|nr:uncharacterized protein LOC121053277 [Oryza brachyantha]